MRRALVASLVLTVACLTTVTWAQWAAAASGTAGARAAVVSPVPRPTAELTAEGVAVAWPTVTATGYAVERIQQETGTTQPACGGTVVTTGCTDAGVPAGTWTYRVRARLGSWQGPASPASAAVQVIGSVSAALDITPRSATPGDDLHLTGTGWTAGQPVAVTVGGATLCTVPAADDGGLTATCTVPERAAGRYAVRATSGVTAVTSGELVVVPGLRSVTPTTSPGGQLQVRGRGFAGSSQVEAWLGDRFLGRAITTQSGETNTMPLSVPADIATGPATLRLVDAAGNEASAPVTVAASGIQVTPARAMPGDTVRVVGAGWPTGAAVSLRIRSNPLCSLTPDASGAIGGDCVVPDTAGGDTQVLATNGTSTVTTPFRILTSLVPTTSATTSPGATLQLKVRGLGSQAAVLLQYDDGPVTSTGFTTPDIGTLTFNTTVPALAPGSHVVRVSDAAGNAATTSLTVVAPELTLSQTSGAAQSTLSVSGQNWPPNVGVSVKFDGSGTNCTPLTRADGSFGPWTCTVPQLAGGPHVVTAASTTAVLGTPLTFTITPRVVLSPTSASPGQPVTLTGTGLPASSTTTFLIGGQQVATPTASSLGQATVSVVVPDLPAGPAVVQAVGSLGSSPEAALAVYRPTVQLGSSTIVPNQPVRVTGTGWPAGILVTVRVGSSTLCAVTAGAGNLDATCTPQSIAGGSGQVVVAVGQQLSSVTATAPGTVTVGAVATLDVNSAAPGRTVFATARGLLPGRPVELYVGGTLVETRTAPADGTWQRGYLVPAGTPAGPLEFEFRQQDVPPVRVTLTVTT